MTLKNIEELSYSYLKKITQIFKKLRGGISDKMTFYYLLAKIYRKLMLKQTNDFKLLFKAWYIMQKFKVENYLYFINLRYYYQSFCNEQSFNNNCNFLIYNSSFYSIHRSVAKFIGNFQSFLNTHENNTSEDYLKFTEKIHKFQEISTKNYNLLTSSTYKDECQRFLYRFVIEGLLNQPINSSYNYLLINEEIVNYEELLEKNFLIVIIYLSGSK